MSESCGSWNFLLWVYTSSSSWPIAKKLPPIPPFPEWTPLCNVSLPLFSSGVESIFHMLHLGLQTWFVLINRGFPAGSDCKESACNAGDLGLIPGLGRSPGEGNGNTLHSAYLENFMDRGAWWATVHGVTKESDTSKRLTLSLSVGCQPSLKGSCTLLSLASESWNPYDTWPKLAFQRMRDHKEKNTTSPVAWQPVDCQACEWSQRRLSSLWPTCQVTAVTQGSPTEVNWANLDQNSCPKDS